MKSFLFLLITILFVSCSSKNDVKINSKLDSLEINQNVLILKTKKDKKSPLSFGLGLGTLIGKNVGLSLGSSVNPSFENTDALNLEKSLALNNVNLNDLIVDELTKQLKEDNQYKNIINKNSSKYILNTALISYDFDSKLLSKKYQIITVLKIVIKAKNSFVLYDKTFKNKINDKNPSYLKNEILKNPKKLEQLFLNSIKDNVKEMVIDLKKS